ncbi:MAG: EF-hand domain-containing protein [Novosphingobium sp.]
MLRKSTMLLAPICAALVLAGCDGKEKETGPDVSPTASIPAVAQPEPPVTAVPAAGSPLASFDRLDAAHDSSISSAEYAQGAQSLFEMMDMAQDGNLDTEELQAGAKMLAEIDGLTPQTLLGVADADRDGKLTLSEWMAFNNARFTLIDSNGDGMIDRGEWAAPHPSLPQQQ